MKLQFKQQAFQLEAVAAIVDLFQGQQRREGIHYLADPGRAETSQLDLVHDAYRNAPLMVSEDSIREQVRAKQLRYGIRPSETLSSQLVAGRKAYNFSIEMETGTGKTYTYIRTIMELNRRYGWLKFIIVVPSVAIREGVLKSFQVMEEHFQMEYGKKPRYFVYDSSRLGDLDTFANSSDIRVMIINSQAFNATGKDARRIHMEQESFRYRKPIEVIAAMNPILIIDEPQSVEGEKTKESLEDFKPLFTLRYSATHKEKYDMVYRLDALDAYNQKLVKKIAVKAVEQTGTTGTEGYLYLQDLVPQKVGSPKARIEFEMRTPSGVKRVTKLVEENFKLYEESGNLEVYRQGWTLSHFDMRGGQNSIQVGANRTLRVGEVLGQTNEMDMRRIQIRETIKSHLEREEALYLKGIKVLSLFFIDEVAKYKCYNDQHEAYNGEYARIFEEEYESLVAAYIKDNPASNYRAYLERHQQASTVHAGYFSVDKVKKSDKLQFVDSKLKRGQDNSDDKDAYDLIMKDKERLLDFEEPVRFLFSHSALKEGWDNPNVFQICTLKQSSADIRKRQEIGRGMRLAVDKHGVRQDQELLGTAVHQINKLTVIANESYDAFSRQLQEELEEALSDRPSKVEVSLFVGRELLDEAGHGLILTKQEAKELEHHLIKEGYIDVEGQLTEVYYSAKEAACLSLPESLQGFEKAVMEVLDTVYDAKRYAPENANNAEVRLAREFRKEKFEEFKSLWEQINHKSIYQVAFDDEELVKKAIQALNEALIKKETTYQITEAAARTMSAEQGLDFRVEKNGRREEDLERPTISVSYDLVGDLTDKTQLKRQTVVAILQGMSPTKFGYFKVNPEYFIHQVANIINEQKAGQIIKHIQYNILEERFDETTFTDNPATVRPAEPHTLEATKSLYPYVKVDSEVEARFQKALEEFKDVKVYAKLPSSFKISTPLGDYNPDWAISFKEGSVSHVYFVAETKGSMSSLQLKGSEKDKIHCARAHFQALKQAGIIEQDQIYGVVSSYEELISLVKGG